MGVALAFGVYFLSALFCFLVATIVGAVSYGASHNGADGGPTSFATVASQISANIFTGAAIWRLTRSERGWLNEIGWRWPGRRWPAFALAGAGLSIGLQMFASLFPSPGKLPIDDFCVDPATGWTMTILGVFFAPPIEEALFRGLLYPVLRKSLGVWAAILLSAAGFALLHASQLGGAWLPIAVIACVGLTLGWTREKSGSLACCVLVHMSYNAVIFAAMILSTGGFRHMEKLAP